MTINLLQVLIESLPEILAMGLSVWAALRRFNRADRELHTDLEALKKEVAANTTAMTAHLREHQAGIPTPRADHLTPVEGTPRGRD